MNFFFFLRKIKEEKEDCLHSQITETKHRVLELVNTVVIWLVANEISGMRQIHASVIWTFKQCILRSTSLFKTFNSICHMDLYEMYCHI